METEHDVLDWGLCPFYAPVSKLSISNRSVDLDSKLGLSTML